MITTLTMNPCVDHTVSIHDFRIGETNRVENTRRDVGGKGVNVSVALHQMGLPTRCLCLGHGDGVMRGHLAATGIPFDEPVPRKWQAALSCLSGGDKNVTKRRACERQLFPRPRIPCRKSIARVGEASFACNTS